MNLKRLYCNYKLNSMKHRRLSYLFPNIFLGILLVLVISALLFTIALNKYFEDDNWDNEIRGHQNIKLSSAEALKDTSGDRHLAIADISLSSLKLNRDEDIPIVQEMSKTGFYDSSQEMHFMKDYAPLPFDHPGSTQNSLRKLFAYKFMSRLGHTLTEGQSKIGQLLMNGINVPNDNTPNSMIQKIKRNNNFKNMNPPINIFNDLFKDHESADIIAGSTEPDQLSDSFESLELTEEEFLSKDLNVGKKLIKPIMKLSMNLIEQIRKNETRGVIDNFDEYYKDINQTTMEIERDDITSTAYSESTDIWEDNFSATTSDNDFSKTSQSNGDNEKLHIINVLEIVSPSTTTRNDFPTDSDLQLDFNETVQMNFSTEGNKNSDLHRASTKLPTFSLSTTEFMNSYATTPIEENSIEFFDGIPIDDDPFPAELPESNTLDSIITEEPDHVMLSDITTDNFEHSGSSPEGFNNKIDMTESDRAESSTVADIDDDKLVQTIVPKLEVYTKLPNQVTIKSKRAAGDELILNDIVRPKERYNNWWDKLKNANSEEVAEGMNNAMKYAMGFVNVMGQVDKYISKRIHSTMTKVARLYDTNEDQRL